MHLPFPSVNLFLREVYFLWRMIQHLSFPRIVSNDFLFLGHLYLLVSPCFPATSWLHSAFPTNSNNFLFEKLWLVNKLKVSAFYKMHTQLLLNMAWRHMILKEMRLSKKFYFQLSTLFKCGNIIQKYIGTGLQLARLFKAGQAR